MIEVITFLASYSNADTAIGGVLETWQQMGFFSYILPFLLIFALVFGILTSINMFTIGKDNNKRPNTVINAIIALAVGLIAISFPGVSEFFAVIFPNLGIALGVILVIFIIAGLFLQKDVPWLNYVLIGIAGIIVIVVLVVSANTLGLPAGEWISENWSMVVAVVIIVGIIVAIIAVSGGTSSPGAKTPLNNPIWARGQ